MLRVLHLEDNETDAFLIAEAVHNEGLQVEFEVVKTRSDFLRALDQANFDIVLSDTGLPGFDGITALKMVRQKCPGIPFICLSGNTTPTHIKANFDMGVSDFISKSDLPRLIEALRREEEH